MTCRSVHSSFSSKVTCQQFEKVFENSQHDYFPLFVLVCFVVGIAIVAWSAFVNTGNQFGSLTKSTGKARSAFVNIGNWFGSLTKSTGRAATELLNSSLGSSSYSSMCSKARRFWLGIVFEMVCGFNFLTFYLCPWQNHNQPYLTITLVQETGIIFFSHTSIKSKVKIKVTRNPIKCCAFSDACCQLTTECSRDCWGPEALIALVLAVALVHY